MKTGMWKKLTGGGGGDCRDCDRLMTDALAGELSAAERERLEAHVAACAECRREYEARRRTWELVAQALAADAAPAGLGEEAHARLAAAMSEPEPSRPSAPTREIKFVWMEIAASIIVVIIALGALLPALSLPREKSARAAASDGLYLQYKHQESAAESAIEAAPSAMRKEMADSEQVLPAADRRIAVGGEAAMRQGRGRREDGAAMADGNAVAMPGPVLDGRVDVPVADEKSQPLLRRRVAGSPDTGGRQAAARDKGSVERGAFGGIAEPSAADAAPPSSPLMAPGAPPPPARAQMAEESRALFKPSAARTESGKGGGGPATEAVQAEQTRGKKDAMLDSARAVAKGKAQLGDLFADDDDLFGDDDGDDDDGDLFAADEVKAGEKKRGHTFGAGVGVGWGAARAPAEKQELRQDEESEIEKKLRGIIVEHIELEDVSIASVAKWLTERSRELDPEGKGVRVVLDAQAEKVADAELQRKQSEIFDDIPPVTMVVSDIPLGEAIRYISRGSNLKYRIEGDAVVLYAQTVPMDPVMTSIFKIDQDLWRMLGGSPGEVRKYLEGKGVVFPVDNAVKYDVDIERLIIKYDMEGEELLRRVIEEVRATVEAQRELSRGLPFIRTEVNPVSTFSLDVDTASYVLARRYLREGQRPPPERVRPEEFINAFDYAYRSPENALFGVYLEAAPGPFRPERTLFRIGVQGRRMGPDLDRPAQFTLLIDTSGSMGRDDRLGLARRCVSLLLDQLRPEDQVAVMVGGYRPQLLVPFTAAAERKTIERIVAGIRPQGETNLERGIVTAYRYALDNFQAGAGNRVLIFTDGIVGFGAREAEPIIAQIESARRQGVTNSVIGFGGDGDDDLMKALAARGDGNYSFLNDERDARRLFEEEFAAKFREIARDVKLQVEFNPALVEAYRQVGYEKRQLSRADFRNDTVDAGEVGAGQSVTVLYELKAAAGSMPMVAGSPPPSRQPLATVRIRYRRADTLEVEEREFYLLPEHLRSRSDDAEPSFRLAAAVAEFAEHLRYPDVPGIASPAGVASLIERLIRTDYRDQPAVREFRDLLGKVR